MEENRFIVTPVVTREEYKKSLIFIHFRRPKRSKPIDIKV